MVGTGQASVTRYYFNSQVAQCIPFIYSGLGGNQNNYISMHDCINSCSVVSQPCKFFSFPRPWLGLAAGKLPTRFGTFTKRIGFRCLVRDGTSHLVPLPWTGAFTKGTGFRSLRPGDFRSRGGKGWDQGCSEFRFRFRRKSHGNTEILPQKVGPCASILQEFFKTFAWQPSKIWLFS